MSATKSTHERPIRTGPYPELTWQAIAIGYLLGVVLAVSMSYAALILGFSIEGSELAAMLGFAVLRGMMGRRSIVENNINQSLASAVNAASAGMVFSLPALFILQYDFNIPLVVLGCIVGGIMGVAFVIPLRKQMIDFERLTFPGGVAVATILKSPGAGMHKAKLLIGAALLSGLIHLLSTIFSFPNIPLGEWLGAPNILNLTFYVSLMTIGVGFIAGRGGFFFIVGGIVCYFILAPVLGGMDHASLASAANGGTDPDTLRIGLFRPLGIGMLIGGALMGVMLAFPLMISAIRSMQSAAKTKGTVSRDEMPIKFLYIAIAGAFVVLLITAIQSTASMGIGRGLLMALLGTLWIWMAGVILSECIGRTNWSPLSGMTLIGITLLIFITRGLDNSMATVVSSVTVGAAMCVAMSQATDLMLDLKTGYLVGATPRKQQAAQFLGTWLGPIVVIVLLFLLHNQSPLGGDKFPAPQGQALAGIITGILGGDVPVQKYIAGAGIGAVLSASGIGGLGILVGLGFYLPFNIVLTYGIGTVLRVFSDRKFGLRWSEETGIPLAAGFIVGEAMIGVFIAVATVLGFDIGGGGH